jgi:protein SCO1
MKKRFAFAVLALFFMPMVALGVIYLSGGFEPKELPIMGQLPQFSLTERAESEVTRDKLERHVWVASFLFTHCAGQCPMIVNSVQRVQKALVFKDRFRLVSFTMDPERDTPEVLRDYAVKVSADPYKWLFLTGEREKLQKLIKDGFRLAVVEGLDEGDDVTHSSKLVLVDGYSRIRGYYDAEDQEQVKRLIKDAKKLLRGTL